ncbi:hypothetical protein AWN76_004610 [Rhodothermaceae bacterium RA]|nr:hypothetical protein AWN76_004610 [Rhodothermaceae bacterium RA]
MEPEYLREAEPFWVGEWLVEPTLNRATKGGEAVRLEPKVLHVLLCLAERPGKTVPREVFMDEVWAGTVVTDDVLARCISELRKLFDDDARNPAYIETIRKTGYRLIAPVRRAHPAPALAPAAVPVAVSATTGELVPDVDPPRRAWWTDRRLLAGLVLIIAVGGMLRYLLSDPAGEPVPPRIVPLTSFPGEELYPALSSDGVFLAFTWTDDPGRYPHVYLKQSGGAVPLQITHAEATDTGPVWSPDQRFLAFVRIHPDQVYQVVMVPSIGGAERVLADLGPRQVQRISWSPDTSQQTLALSVRTGPHGPFRIMQLALDADTLRPLTEPPHYSIGDLDPVYAPDGRQLAFVRSITEGIEDVYLVAAQGGEPVQLTTDSTRITGLDWTPTGDAVIVASEREGTSALWRIPVRGGAAEWITAAPKGAMLLHPSVAREGQGMAYVQRVDEVNIGVLGPGSSGVEPLITSTQWDSHPSLSPSGQRIAFISRRTGYPEVWVADADGRNPFQVTTLQNRATELPRWSPDERLLCFVTREHGNADIYVVNVDSGVLWPLTRSPSEEVMPSWSRDGQAIYFASNRTGAWQIWRQRLGDEAAEQVTLHGGFAAQEGPEGRFLYLFRPDTSGIWRYPLGLPQTVPPDDTLGRLVSLEGAVQHPDSTRFGRPGLSLDLVVPGLDDVDAGNWMVTAHGIFFPMRRGRRTVLGYYRFGDGSIASLRLLPPLPPHPSLSVSYDGDRVLVTQIQRRESDILFIERPW